MARSREKEEKVLEDKVEWVGLRTIRWRGGMERRDKDDDGV